MHPFSMGSVLRMRQGVAQPHTQLKQLLLTRLCHTLCAGLYSGMQEKVIQNYALYYDGVAWVDKPKVSDGLSL